MGGLQNNDLDEIEKRKQVAVRVLSSCGLDKETVQKRFGLIGDEKEKPFILSFKPSSEIHSPAIPFVAPDKKIARDGMGVPNPLEVSE